MKSVIIIAIAVVLLIPSSVFAQQHSISITGNQNPIEYVGAEFFVNFDGGIYNNGKIYWGVFEKNSSNKPTQLEILDEDTTGWAKTVQLGTFYTAGKTYIFEIRSGSIIEQFEFTVQDKIESPSQSFTSGTLSPFFDKCENDLWIGHFEDEKTGERIKFGKVFLYDDKGQRTKITSLIPPEGYLKIFPNGNENYPSVSSALLRVESYDDLSFSPVCLKVHEPETPLQESQISQITTKTPPPTLMVTTDDDELGTSIKSTNSYVDDYGYAHIIGEFVNNQDKTLNFVKFIATLYDSSGNVLDTEFSFSTIDIVAPFTKTPFEITVSGNVEMIDTFEIQSSGTETFPLPQKLELSPVRVFEDEYGSHHIVGEVFNTGDSTAHYVKVISNFYDSNDEIVGIGWTFTTIDNIYPNGKSPFEITISDFVSTNGYSFQKPFESYSLFVQSQEYGLIYEYPEYVQEVNEDPEVNDEPKVMVTSNPEIHQNDSKNGGGCLIATATYGSELAPQVQQLRELRDNSLLQTESGTSFMNAFNDFYYSFSPVIADYERENPVFREGIKLFITPMISTLSIMILAEEGSESQVLGLGISIILLNIGMYVVGPVIGITKIKKHIQRKQTR